MTLDRGTVQGHWVHSHEEDTEGEMVYRPASYAFPPSRGRAALDLHADGSYSESTPGPTDRPESADGTWELDGEELRLNGADGSKRVLEIAAASGGRLVVRR
jgi:hypothetical protein